MQKTGAFNQKPNVIKNQKNDSYSNGHQRKIHNLSSNRSTASSKFVSIENLDSGPISQIFASEKYDISQLLTGTPSMPPLPGRVKVKRKASVKTQPVVKSFNPKK